MFLNYDKYIYLFYISFLYAIAPKEKPSLNIREWAINQTSLDEVFVYIAKKDENE